MKLFFASPYTDIKNILKHNVKVLSSYVECMKKDVSIFKNDFFLDSGAFSVFTGAIDNINIDNYIQFIKKNNIKIYAGLDVIGSAEKTIQNIIYMEKQGLSPIPTFHHGESFNILEDYCKKYDYIAIGGMAGDLKRKQDQLRYFLKDVFKITKKIRLHGFGLTGNLLLEFPFYSADSTGWISATRHRKVVYFTGSRISTYAAVTKKNIENRSCFKNTLKSVSLTNRKDEDLTEAAMLEYIKFEKYLTVLWEKRGIIWKD